MSDIVKSAPVTTDRDALAILGYADSLDGRALVSEGNGDLLPYEVEFEALVELIEAKAEKNFDSRGLRVKLKVEESSNPTKVKVNSTYTLWFFDQHKSLPSQVLAEMVSQRIVFAATIAGYAGDPLEELPDGTPKFKAGETLIDLHRSVEPLGLKMRLKNTYLRTTRNGKRLHKLSFEMV
jgi:hypothetical protein